MKVNSNIFKSLKDKKGALSGYLIFKVTDNILICKRDMTILKTAKSTFIEILKLVKKLFSLIIPVVVTKDEKLDLIKDKEVEYIKAKLPNSKHKKSQSNRFNFDEEI